MTADTAIAGDPRTPGLALGGAPSLPYVWNPGEHMAVGGQTGSGKSTLMRTVLTARKFYVVLRTKPDKVKYVVEKKTQHAATMYDHRFDRIELEPKYQEQQVECARALEYAWKHGRWTMYVDELYYFIRQLRLEDFVERGLTQGRSKGMTMVVGMQRPVRVTRFAISEATHVVMGNLEGRDARTVGEATWDAYEEAVQTLPRYHFAWGYRPTKSVTIVTAQSLGGTAR